MVFSSNIFLFAFLPIFLIVYYLSPLRWRSLTILIFSYGFYAWWRPDFLALLLGVTIISFLCARAVHATQNPKQRLQLTSVGVGLNLLALAYFKYANFGIGTINNLMQNLGWQPLAWTNILLPIGLSFYIFHAISYIVDVHRHDAPPAQNPIDFAAFIALFPHLVAGPVLRYHLLAEQFKNRSHTTQKFMRGTIRFMQGFCKKVLIADSVAPLANTVFGAINPSFGESWLGAIAYSIQLFFDFSGYSDMAIGLALMIGFVFPENFNDPYLSKSITEFWKRWHMSLSSWLREYLYIPLGGNRHGTNRTYINLFLTMLLGGLWHGANLTFVLWGAWHGGLLVLEKYLDEKFQRPAAPIFYSIPKTMILVIIGWVMFRAKNLNEAFKIYGGMLGLHGFSNSPDVAWKITPDQVLVLFTGIGLAYLIPWWRKIAAQNEQLMAWSYSFQYALIPLFAWASATLSAQSFAPFLYFQF